MSVKILNIAVASTNPVKLDAARKGFAQAFPDFQIQVSGYAVTAYIPAQPMGDQETYQGALTRTRALSIQVPQADFWVGIEGGVQRSVDGCYDSFAWIVVQKTPQQQYSSRTSTFPLPPRVCKLLDEGMELGEADDQVFGRSQSKQQNGAIGLLTHDQITRTDLLAQSVFLALIPFQSPNLFQ